MRQVIAVLCREVRQEPGGGTTLVRVFDTLAFPVMPLALDVPYYVETELERSEEGASAVVVITVTSADGHIAYRDVQTVELPARRIPGRQQRWTSAGVARLDLRGVSHGPLEFTIEANGVPVAWRTFEIVRDLDSDGG